MSTPTGLRVLVREINLAAGTPGSVIIPNPFTEQGVPSARVVDFDFVPDADLALDGTNFMTLNVRDLGDTTDLSAKVSNEAALLSKGVAANGAIVNSTLGEVASGASLTVKKTEDGTGALAKGLLLLTFEPNRYSV